MPVWRIPIEEDKGLAQAGYKDGLTIKGYMTNRDISTTLAEPIKNMPAKVGITWKVELLDLAAISQKMRKVDYDFTQGGWTWIHDPDLIAKGLYQSGGRF